MPKTIQTSLGYYAAYLILGLVVGLTGPVLPYLAKQTHTGLDTISSMFIARSVGYLIGAFSGGRAYDRMPGNLILALAVLVGAGALAGVPFTSTPIMLVVLISFLGLAEGTIDVGGNILILRLYNEKVGPFMNALHFFFGVGALLAPIAVAQILLRTNAIDWVFWFLALLALPIALWIFLTPSLVTFAKPRRTGGGVKINILLLGGVMFVFILYVGAEIGYANWLFTYATTSGIIGEVAAAYLTSVFWGVFTLGRLLGIPMAGRLKPHIIILIGLAGSVISIGLILFFSESVQVLWAGTALLGLSMASIYPVLILFAAERMHLTGQITSWFLISTGFGAMFLPWLIGQFITGFGPQVTIIFVFIDLVAAFIVFLGLKTIFPLKKSQKDG